MADERRTPVIGIIGLGRLGRSYGLALQGVKSTYEILGQDDADERVKAAKQSGAVDRTHWNPVAVAESADLLILTSPDQSEVIGLIESVAQVLRPGTLVTDTLPMKRPVLEAAERALPQHASFVGGHPIVDPTAEPEAEAFLGSTYCLVASPTASEEAVRVLTQLVKAIGADPYFIDAYEHDGLAMGIGALPYLLSAATLRVMAQSPSARDLKRLAGPRFGIVAGAASARGSYADVLEAGADPLVAWIDAIQRELSRLREALQAEEATQLSQVLDEIDAALEEWEDTEEAPGKSRAFEELEDRNMVMDALFGSWGRHPLKGRRDDSRDEE